MKVYAKRWIWLLTLCVAAPAPTWAAKYVLPAHGGRIIGHIQYVTAGKGDTLLDIARRFDVGYREIRLANPNVDVWLPGIGTRIKIPTQFILPDAPHVGIVVNVPEMRVYYYPKPKHGAAQTVETFPISIGRQNWTTPLGTTRIVTKIKHPAWYPPASIRAEHASKGDALPKVVPAGPDNPLGQFALRLGIPGYLMHGTNKPYGIGMRVSHGCIRLYPEDIKNLFAQVPKDTSVHLVDQPYKAAWHDGQLYLESSPLPSVEGASNFGPSSREPMLPEDLPKLLQVVSRATRGSGYAPNWGPIEAMAMNYDGLPHTVPLVGQLKPAKGSVRTAALHQ